MIAGSLLLLLGMIWYAQLVRASATYRYIYHTIMSAIARTLRDELQHAASTHWRQAQHAIVDDLSSRRDPEVRS
jgi:hypothetical protein